MYGPHVIIQPNQRRRTRLFRAATGIVAVLMVGTVLVSGRAFPVASSVADPSATLLAAIGPASSARPSVALPTATIPVLPPSPAPSITGCAPAPTGLVPAVVTFRGPRTEKRIALTFDDGTNPENVLRILRILKRMRVNATFFPTGRSVERFPDVWHRVAEAGFPIGNHTYSHRSLAGLCYEAQLAELRRSGGVLAGLDIPMLGVMRPPYEEFDAATRLAASSTGASHVVLWDVDTEDWTGVGARTIARRALAGRAGSIVLMHTSTLNTSAALPRIIRRYRDRGYSFVTVGTLLGLPGSVPFP
jgi:peptidoglycan/xylan/chitin deacetylase (PgdA/CDA1 family)